VGVDWTDLSQSRVQGRSFVRQMKKIRREQKEEECKFLGWNYRTYAYCCHTSSNIDDISKLKRLNRFEE